MRFRDTRKRARAVVVDCTVEGRALSLAPLPSILLPLLSEECALRARLRDTKRPRRRQTRLLLPIWFIFVQAAAMLIDRLEVRRGDILRAFIDQGLSPKDNG